VRLTFAASTDPGRVRRVNEDEYVAEPELGFFAVIDGMGGHAAGRVASATIAESIRTFIRQTAQGTDHTWPFGLDPRLSGMGNRMQVAIRSANRQLAAKVEADATLNGTGATLAASLFGNGRVVVSNVGDCRVYLVRDDTLTQITRDHSLVAEEVAMGLINSEEARTHPLRHVVTRAVSGDASMIVDIWERDVQAGDRVLICSDGVHGVLTDEALAAWARDTRPLADICRGVVEDVHAHGAPDNATVVLVSVEDAHG
jgi:protein phosphatase